MSNISKLPVNFKDDVLASSMSGKRRYILTNNADGTTTIEDASVYDQVGSNFGATQINATNQAINDLIDNSSVVEVTGTLTTGSTSLVLSNSAITTNSTVDIYTSKFGVSPTDMVISTGKVTLTFDAQQDALSVKIRVS